MRKFNFFMMLFLLVGFSAFGQYQQTTSLSCFQSPDGTPMTLSFTNVPSPASGGVVTFYYQGDLDLSTEVFDVSDEGTNIIGTSPPASGQCQTSLDSFKINVTLTQLTSWAADGVIDFTLSPATNVSTTLCTPCTGAQAKIEYTAGGGPNDATVFSVDSPAAFCSGTEPIYVSIGNAGTNQIDSVDVNWEINGVAQPSVQYVGLIDTINGSNPNFVQVFLGNYNFPQGLTEIKVFTSNPNGVADTSNMNDTLTVLIGPRMSGVYTLDSSSPTSGTNFNSFGDLAYSLNTFGVCGPTVINVAPGTYSEQFSLRDIPGSSSINTVLIDGQNSNLATLTHDQSSRNSTVTLERVQYVEIKNLTIEATATSDSWGVHIFDSSHHVSLDSNRILMPIGSNSDVAGIMISNSETSDASQYFNAFNTRITNNEVVGGERGISAYGDFSDLNIDLLIENNTVHSSYDYGIYVYYFDSVYVRGNEVNNIQSSAGDALYMSDVENFEVSGNFLIGQDNGMDADDLNFNNAVVSNSQIFNNMFVGGDDGAYFDDSESIDFYHNSFKGEDYGVYANDHLNWELKNNIFYGNTNYAFYTPDSLAITMDYNVYYTGGSDLIRFGGTTNIYADLLAFQAAAPTLNVNSLEGDPVFTSANNLHLIGSIANDVGDNSIGINVDIDGDSRPLSPSTTVDIGADEYNPPSCPGVSALTATAAGANSIGLSWTAGGTETEWEVEHGPTGFTKGTGNISLVNTSPNTTISGLSPSTAYDFYVRAVCGAGDTSLWSFMPITVLTTCVKDTIPFIDDFSSGTLSQCWTISDPAYVSIENTCDTRTDVIDINYEEEAITPVIKASAAQSIEISYYIGAGACINDPEDTEHFHVEYWDGTQWTLLKDYDGSWPEAFVWETFYLPAGSYDDSLMVRFNMIDGTTDAWQIDSVVIKEGPSCIPPSDVTASNITSDSVSIAWNSFNSSSLTYEYELVECGNPQGSGSISSTTTLDSVRIGNLNSNTCYEVYIREICSSSDTSSWNLGTSFFTPCSIESLPFVDDFSLGAISPCWTISDPTYVSIETTCDGRNNVIDINYEEEAITPPIDVLGTQSIEISYYIGAGACINDPEDNEHFHVEYWDGSQWVLLRDYDGSWPEAFVWESFTLMPGSYSDTLQVRFNMIDGTTDAWQIDSVVVQEGPAIDAAVAEVISPSGSLCPGSVTPVVGVENIGSTTLDSVKVYWDINGVIDSLTYIGTINMGDTAAVTLSTLNVQAGQLYDIKFYTGMPNGIADERPVNDTLSINGLKTGLVGNYTLDASQASSATNYTSFSSLADDLNNFGVCGAVNVDVAAGVYNDVFHLNNIGGVSAANRVTIDGVDSSLARLTNNLSSADAVMDFMGASYITVKNMTIESSYTGSGDYAVVHYGAAANYDSLINCHILLDPTNTSGGMGIGASTSADNDLGEGDNANFTVIMNNHVEGGSYSIHFEGKSTGEWNVGNEFINNTLYNMDDYGIYLDQQDSVSVIGNHISGNRSSFGDGIYAFDAMNFICNKNFVHSPDYGIYWADANSDKTRDRIAEVNNNMVISDGDYGIYMTDAVDVNVMHNSVYVEGSSPAFRVFGSLSSGLDVRNNIFTSLNSEAFESGEPDTIFIKLDYNLYNSNGPVLINIDGTGYATLAGYQSVNPILNTASLEGNPQFISNIDLHILGSFVDGQGDGSVGITEDIDGDPRPMPGATNVDIGADEFDPPSCPRPLNFSFYNSSIDSVTVAWDGNISAGDYEIEIVDCGNPQGSGTTSVIVGDSVTLGGLTPNLCYEIYVREICARGDTSLWADSFEFGLIDSCESFDNYVLGPVDEQSILIDGWDNAQGDAEVSNDYASSGSNSLKIHDSGPSGYSDVIANLDTYTSGKWSISIDFLIPQGNGGYYNILHNYLGGGGSVWAIETYLDASGVATVNEGTNGTGVIGTYNFTPGAWNSISHIIDLDNDTAYLLINSVPTNVGWQFSLGAPNGNQFNAFNFFSAANAGQTPLMYFDNFCIKAYEEAPIDGAIVDLTAPLDDGLQCYSTTEAVSVELVNTGLDSLDFTVDTAEVTMVISGAASQTLSFTVSDNTLNGGLPLDRGESIEVPLGSFDMSTIGTYYFDAIVDITADGVQSNDAYSDSITTQAYDGGMVSDNDSICAGDTIELTVSGSYGGVQWQEFDGTNFVDINGATEASIEVDPTNTTEYRVQVCGAAVSDTVEVYVTNVPTPVVSGDTAVVPCGAEGTAIVDLTSSQQGSYFVWYDSSQAGNEITTGGKYYVSNNGDTLRYTDSATTVNTSAYDTVWVEEVVGTGSSESLLITEFDPGSPDMLEIQNVSNSSVDVTGWTVAISDDYNDINEVNTIVQTLNGTWSPGQIEYWDDQAGPNDWGNNIFWSQSNNAGWILLIDDVGNIVDFVAWEWTAADIQSMSVTVNSFTITPGTSGAWIGDGVDVNPHVTGSGFSRIGSSDNDDLNDFVLQTLSTGTNNPNLQLPFRSSCSSNRAMVVVGVDCLVGLEGDNSAVAGNIEVYPNPSNGLFTLNITTEQEENFVLSVRDVQGKLIYEENLTVNGAHRDDLDLVGLAKGVYYLQIQNDQATKVEKLIIQ